MHSPFVHDKGLACKARFRQFINPNTLITPKQSLLRRVWVAIT